MARAKRTYNKRKNPYGLPFFVVPALIGLAIGGAGIGATYAYLKIDEASYGPQVSVAFNNAQDLLASVVENRYQAYRETVGITPSILSVPTNLGFAWAKIAFYAAEAAGKLQNEGYEADVVQPYVDLAQRYLAMFRGVYSGGAWEDTEAIAQTLKDASVELDALPQAQLVQSEINHIRSEADPTRIQNERNEQGAIAPNSADEFLYRTAADILAPMSLAAGLWTGKVPFGWDTKTFRMVQIAVYGALGIGAITYLSGSIGKFKEALNIGGDD